MEMLAAQAAHRDGSVHEDEEAVVSNEKLSEEEKKDMLQKALNMAASNGDVERIERILRGCIRRHTLPVIQRLWQIVREGPRSFYFLLYAEAAA